MKFLQFKNPEEGAYKIGGTFTIIDGKVENIDTEHKLVQAVFGEFEYRNVNGITHITSTNTGDSGALIKIYLSSETVSEYNPEPHIKNIIIEKVRDTYYIRKNLDLRDKYYWEYRDYTSNINREEYTYLLSGGKNMLFLPKVGSKGMVFLIEDSVETLGVEPFDGGLEEYYDKEAIIVSEKDTIETEYIERLSDYPLLKIFGDSLKEITKYNLENGMEIYKKEYKKYAISETTLYSKVAETSKMDLFYNSSYVDKKKPTEVFYIKWDLSYGKEHKKGSEDLATLLTRKNIAIRPFGTDCNIMYGKGVNDVIDTDQILGKYSINDIMDLVKYMASNMYNPDVIDAYSHCVLYDSQYCIAIDKGYSTDLDLSDFHDGDETQFSIDYDQGAFVCYRISEIDGGVEIKYLYNLDQYIDDILDKNGEPVMDCSGMLIVRAGGIPRDYELPDYPEGVKYQDSEYTVSEALSIDNFALALQNLIIKSTKYGRGSAEHYIRRLFEDLA